MPKVSAVLLVCHVGMHLYPTKTIAPFNSQRHEGIIIRMAMLVF